MFPFSRSTPNRDVDRFLKKQEGKKTKAPAVKAKKKDVYLYNFIEHRPKYVYTTDEYRLARKKNHYDEHANNPNFKKATQNFYAVEEDFPRPDYNKRGPVEHEQQVSSMNRVYGGKIPLHL